MWEPLPLIVYGYAIHPLSPSRRDTYSTPRNRLSTVTEASADEHTFTNVVNLEVGDEVYAFEKYTPSPREPVDGIWYRGYVVCTTRRPPVVWSLSSEGSNPRPPAKSEESQQVFIGIFPRSHIYIRDELTDAEGRLPELHRTLNGGGSTTSSQNSGYGRDSPADLYSAWNKDKATLGMGTVMEEPEDEYQAGRTSYRLGPPPDQAHSSRAGLPVYSNSIRSASPTDSQVAKPPPPRPSLKSGDDTREGQKQPIIDEIASALREWHHLMFQYLARRDYQLFHMVKDQIEALHLGRRQLLASALSAEETVNMRRDCVTKLVVGNLIQGLDVIVRHPTWGGLVNVDVEGGGDPRSWISAIRMYTMQVSLAYLDILREDIKLGGLRRSVDYLTNGSIPTPAHSAFPNLIHQPHRKSHSQATISPSDVPKPSPTKFYHVFLDLRAFVASLCAPGESAELFFSLWTKHTCQFLTEDFCAILNHNGVLARDPSSRIRTLFTDLTISDVQDPIYLVCRIVRTGALKIGPDASTGTVGSESVSRSASFSPLGTGSYWAEDASPISSSGASRHFGEGQLRRPFGCAILELTDLAKMLAEQSDVSVLREHTLPIYVPTNETSFSMIHQNIVNGVVKEYEKSPRAESLAVSVKFFRGDLPTVLRENTTLLQDIPHTLRLGFPDAVFPGETRNELYIKLWCGDFTASHSSSGRLSVTNFARGTIGHSSTNVQITVEVRDSDGQIIPNVIYQGSGEPPVTQFHSIVFQRCTEPTFGELIKIRLPTEGIPNWHLFFTFRNRSSRPSPSRNPAESGDRPYAFAFQPLFPDANTFVKDGSHTLVLYRADKLNSVTVEHYLGAQCRLMPGQKVDQIPLSPDMQRLAPAVRDSLTIRSSLTSTRFTHNQVLLRLLNWESLDHDALTRLMAELPFIGESEIVKYLRDVFDSLFGILVSTSNQSGELDLMVFNALVSILLIVQDRRFSNFQPVLDVYIDRHFSFGTAASHIIHSMNRLLTNPTSLESAKPLRSALKVWHYIFKFIARSRELQKIKELGMGGGATAEHLESKFKKELRSHLAEVTGMMSIASPASIIGTQTIALQHFTSILPELAKMFNTVELVSVVTTFANAVNASKGKIVIWKLIMYLQIVKGFLFDNPESRPLLVDAVVIWIKPHFGRYDEYAHTHTTDTESVKDAARVGWLECVRLCVTIIAVMLDKLQQSLVSPTVLNDQRSLRKEQDNVETLLHLMPKLLDSYREIQSPSSRTAIERTHTPSTTKAAVPVTFPESYPFSLVTALPEDRSSGPVYTQKDGAFYPSLGETAIVFLALVLTAPTRHIVAYFQEHFDIEGRDRFVNFLMQFFKTAVSILDNEAFPRAWLNANVLAHKVLVKIMDPIATMLTNEFIPRKGSDYAFDANLWKDAFHMLLKVLSSDHLVIEQFSPQKRRAIWRLAGDLRGEGASILLNLWQALDHDPTDEASPDGGYQIYLFPLVGHVVNLCLSHHDQLRSNAVTILSHMVVSEYEHDGHFDDIENEVVTKLDSLFMSDSKGDDISRAFFIGQLRLLFENAEVDDELRQRVGNFLDSVDLFLELLLSVRALPEGEEYADDRVIATLRLMNFIRRIGRDEIYIKYVHQLVNMHLQSQSYVEAALTLKLHADLHEWDLNSFVPPMEDLGLPQQSHFHRKETLCLLILDYLGKGKAWENAVDICRELAFQHAEVTFNYARLSEILRHQSTLLEHIITEQRYYPDYYRVTFYGNFPQAIRNKRFIYRGYDWEKYGAFCERMLNKHPGAQLYKAAGEPPADILYGNDQYIQCTAVTPEPNRDLPIFTNPDVPLAVKTYYEHCGINLFSSTRQARKIFNNVEETWIEKTYYTTEEAFPTVLRRSEVVVTKCIELSPLENALNEVETKTKELTTLHAKYNALAKTTQQVSTNALAMALNSAVDAPLNTGIASYRQLFFNPEYLDQHPERAELVDQLRAAIEEQVHVIDNCLRLHGLLCSPEFIPFHETLMKFFRKNFRDEIRKLVVDDGTDSLMSPNGPQRFPDGPYTPSTPYDTYPGSVSLSRSFSTSSSQRNNTYIIPPLQLGKNTLTPPPGSPAGAAHNILGSGSSQQLPPTKQTPLQRHLAHLTKHGINAVSSSPGQMPADDGSSPTESPHNSFVNVGNGPSNGIQGTLIGGAHSTTQVSSGATSTAGSYMGSIGSFGSLRGRFSRFGSLNFGRRNGNPS